MAEEFQDEFRDGGGLTAAKVERLTTEERVVAALCHFGSLFAMPVLLAGVIHEVEKNRSDFIRFHAMQAAVYQASAIAILCVIGALTSMFVLATCGWALPMFLLVIATALVFVAVDAYYGVLAFRGHRVELPMLVDLERRLGIGRAKAR